MNYASGMETSTKIYFLFIFNLVYIRIRKTSLFRPMMTCLQNCGYVVLSAIRASSNTIPYRSINLLGPKGKNAYLGSFVNRGIFTRVSLSPLTNGRPEHTKK